MPEDRSGAVAEAARDFEMQRPAAAREACRSLEKLVSGGAVSDPAAAQIRLEHTVELIHRFTGAFGELSVSLAPECLFLDGVRVTEHNTARENPFYDAYRDGLRRLVLLPTIDENELSSLVAALHHTSVELGEDDVVTLLWSAALKHTRFYQADPFPDEAETADVQAQQARDIVARSYEFARDVQEARTPWARRSDRPGNKASRRWRVPSPDTIDAALESPTPSTLGQPASELAADLVRPPSFLIDRYLHVLLLSLAVPADDGAAPVVIEIIASIVEQLLQRGELEQAAQILQRVQSALFDPDLPATEESATQLGHRLANDRVIQPVLEAFVNVSQAADPIARIASAASVLRRLPAETLGLVFTLTDQHGEPGFRQEVLTHVCERSDLPAVLAALATIVKHATEGHALQILHMAEGLPDEGAVGVFEHAMGHVKPRVQGEAFLHLLRRAPVSKALQYASEALEGDDAKQMSLAVDFMVHAQSQQGGESIRNIVNAGLDQYEVQVRYRLCQGLVELLSEAAVPILISILEHRNILGRASLENSRSAAATALGMTRSSAARDALERVASSRVTRKKLKKICKAAIANIDDPRPRPVRQFPHLQRLSDDRAEGDKQ